MDGLIIAKEYETEDLEYSIRNLNSSYLSYRVALEAYSFLLKNYSTDFFNFYSAYPNIKTHKLPKLTKLELDTRKLFKLYSDKEFNSLKVWIENNRDYESFDHFLLSTLVSFK